MNQNRRHLRKEIHDARGRSLSRATVAVVQHIKPALPGTKNIHALGLYDMKDKSWCELPSFPFDGAMPSECQCISLDGKIYVLGGVENSHSDLARRDVWKLDLAGEMRWKQCAIMLKKRMAFGVGALHGKLYVFGGSNNDGPVYGCEVYDPNVDTWSITEDMEESRMFHQVAVVEEEFFLYNGFIEEDSEDSHWLCSMPEFILVYNPERNQWRKIHHGENNWLHDVFMAKGAFYRLTRDGIHLFDIDIELPVEQSWSFLHSFSDVSNELISSKGLQHFGPTIPLGGELLTLSHIHSDATTPGVCLLQTKAFGGGNEEIGLELVKCSLGEFNPGSTQILPLRQRGDTADQGDAADQIAPHFRFKPIFLYGSYTTSNCLEM